MRRKGSTNKELLSGNGIFYPPGFWQEEGMGENANFF